MRRRLLVLAPLVLAVPFAGASTAPPSDLGAWLPETQAPTAADPAASMRARAGLGVRSAASAAHGLDTVLTVRPGDVLAVDAGEGRLFFERGADGRLRIEGGEGRRGVEVTHRGSRVTVRPRAADRELSGALRFEVPPGVHVEVTGHALDVDLHDLVGDVSVRVIEGDLTASGIEGDVDLYTLDGEIELANLQGSASCETVDGDVHVRGLTGARLLAQALDGDLVLEGVRSGEVSASTVDGDVLFVGAVPTGALLRLVTHSGDVEAVLPEGSSADVEVATFAGEFMPEIPVRVGRIQAGQPLRFQMGAGGARIEMKAFDGDIVLRHGTAARRR